MESDCCHDARRAHKAGATQASPKTSIWVEGEEEKMKRETISVISTLLNEELTERKCQLDKALISNSGIENALSAYKKILFVLSDFLEAKFNDD